MTTVWLRNVGDEDECWVPCARFDTGATEFRNDAHVWCNRQIDDLTEMCKSLLEEKKAWHDSRVIPTPGSSSPVTDNRTPRD